MKLFYFFLALITFQTSFAQKTILQPALRDSDKKLDSIYGYRQYTGQNEFLLDIMRNQTFDSDKNPVTSSYESFDENSNLIKKTRVTATYFPSDVYFTETFLISFPIKQTTSEILNLDTNTWLPEYTSTFFEKEKLNIHSQESLNLQIFLYNDNYDITYASKYEAQLANNFPIDYLEYSWNTTTNTFEQSYKYILYNTFTSGILTTRTYNKITDFNTNNEETYLKEEYVDVSPSPSYEKTTFIWNGTTWDNLEFKQVNYTNNLIDNVLVYNWDNSTNNWVEHLRLEYTYDDNDNIVDFKRYYNQILEVHETLTYDSDNLVTASLSYNYNTTTGNLSFTDRSVLYYSPDNSLKISNTDFDSLNVYPNPAKSTLNIDFLKPFNYEITSLQGVKVLQGKSQGFIDVQSLQNGAYLITMEYNNQHTTKKIIINK